MTSDTISKTPPAGGLTVFPTDPVEAGKGGKGGELRITNAEFISAVFPSLPEGAFAAACSKASNPDIGGRICKRGDPVADDLTAG